MQKIITPMWGNVIPIVEEFSGGNCSSILCSVVTKFHALYSPCELSLKAKGPQNISFIFKSDA